MQKMLWFSKCFLFVSMIILSINVLANDQFVIIETMDIEPFGFSKKELSSQEQKGLYYDFANKIVENAGLIPKNHIVPFARAHESVILGRADFTIMFSTKELEKNAHQSKSIFEFENLVIGKKDLKLKQLSDLNGLTIGRIRSGCADLLAKDDISPKKYFEFNNYNQGIQLLISNRLDAICGSLFPVEYAMKVAGVTKEQLGPILVVSRRPAFVHFSKKLPHDKREKLEKSIQELIKSKFFEELSKKYVSKNELKKF